MTRTKRAKPGGERRIAQQKDFVNELLGKSSQYEAEHHSYGRIKKRLRDVNRLLDSGKQLPADVEVEKQRERDSLQHNLTKLETKRKRSRIIGKYHKVRFHERQKAERQLKQAKRALEAANDPAQQESLRLKVHVAQVDLNYALYHPLLVPYSSLFVEKSDNDANETTQVLVKKRQNQVWKSVEEATQSGDAALQALRSKGYDHEVEMTRPKSGKTIISKNKMPKAKAPQISGKQKIVSEVVGEEDEEDDDSDDNFFE